VNFLRKAQKVACAEGIVSQDLDCDWLLADAARMRRTFRKMLDAGGNEYDAAIGFVVELIQERLDLIDGLMPKTLLWKSTPDVLAKLRLRADRKPIAEAGAP
jgi:hypothetical protein